MRHCDNICKRMFSSLHANMLERRGVAKSLSRVSAPFKQQLDDIDARHDSIEIDTAFLRCNQSEVSASWRINPHEKNWRSISDGLFLTVFSLSICYDPAIAIRYGREKEPSIKGKESRDVICERSHVILILSRRTIGSGCNSQQRQDIVLSPELIILVGHTMFKTIPIL